MQPTQVTPELRPTCHSTGSPCSRLRGSVQRGPGLCAPECRHAARARRAAARAGEAAASPARAVPSGPQCAQGSHTHRMTSGISRWPFTVRVVCLTLGFQPGLPEQSDLVTVVRGRRPDAVSDAAPEAVATWEARPAASPGTATRCSHSARQLGARLRELPEAWWPRRPVPCPPRRASAADGPRPALRCSEPGASCRMFR